MTDLVQELRELLEKHENIFPFGLGAYDRLLDSRHAIIKRLPALLSRLSRMEEALRETRDAVIEECAKAADAISAKYTGVAGKYASNTKTMQDWATGASYAARDIRALKSPPPREQEAGVAESGPGAKPGNP
jgi:recombinational DNA repair ATPase RecF